MYHQVGLRLPHSFSSYCTVRAIDLMQNVIGFLCKYLEVVIQKCQLLYIVNYSKFNPFTPKLIIQILPTIQEEND